MLASPMNIRENGRLAATQIQEAVEALKGAASESKTPPGKGRTDALLRAAACHAEVVKKLDKAIELMKELYQ
jgi:hypothetical protein